MGAFWLLGFLSIVLGLLAVYFMPVSGTKRIQSWMALEIVGTLLAAGLMYILLSINNNPKWRQAYNDLKARLNG